MISRTLCLVPLFTKRNCAHEKTETVHFELCRGDFSVHWNAGTSHSLLPVSMETGNLLLDVRIIHITVGVIVII